IDDLIDCVEIFLRGMNYDPGRIWRFGNQLPLGEGTRASVHFETINSFAIGPAIDGTCVRTYIREQVTMFRACRQPSYCTNMSEGNWNCSLDEVPAGPDANTIWISHRSVSSKPAF